MYGCPTLFLLKMTCIPLGVPFYKQNIITLETIFNNPEPFVHPQVLYLPDLT